MPNARPGSVPPQQHHGPAMRIYRIEGRTATGLQDGAGNGIQWVYDVVEVYNAPGTVGLSGTTQGYDSSWTAYPAGGWQAFEPGTGNTAKARNLMEYGADGTGRQPSGVDVDGPCFVAESAEIQPLQTSAIHPGLVLPFHRGVTGSGLDYYIWIIPYQAWDV